MPTDIRCVLCHASLPWHPQRLYCADCRKVASLAQQRERRSRDPEGARIRMRRYTAAWRERNPGVAEARAAAWHVANRERAQATRRAYREAHKDELNQKKAAYKRANPEIVRASNARRRAAKSGTHGAHTETEWLARCAEFANRCAYCDEATVLQRDHVIPLIKGGRDSIENVVPACQPCNYAKNGKYLSEWLGIWTADGDTIDCY